jgi:hypothetical protein
MRYIVVSALLGLAAATAVEAQTKADSAAIRATALDYIDGWYTGDAARMERSLHPDLAKRIVITENNRSRLSHQGAQTLIESTRNGSGRRTPEAERRNQVRILDIFGDAAAVKVTASEWIDYMHMAKFNGRWVIVNVLWELDNPKKG